jgi:hypothetical protein
MIRARAGLADRGILNGGCLLHIPGETEHRFRGNLNAL